MSLQYVTFQYIALNESQNMIIQSKAQGEKTKGEKKPQKGCTWPSKKTAAHSTHAFAFMNAVYQTSDFNEMPSANNW